MHETSLKKKIKRQRERERKKERKKKEKKKRGGGYNLASCVSKVNNATLR
jgi:hypothetical protein